MLQTGLVSLLAVPMRQLIMRGAGDVNGRLANECEQVGVASLTDQGFLLCSDMVASECVSRHMTGLSQDGSLVKVWLDGRDNGRKVGGAR